MKRSSRFDIRAILVAGIGALLLQAIAGSSPGFGQTTADAIRIRIEAGHATGGITASGKRIFAQSALASFYRGSGFEPAWNAPARLDSLIAGIRAAETLGLRPSDYHSDLLVSTKTSVAAVDRELLATDAFLLLGSHLFNGRVNPENLEAEWTANRRNTDMAAVLEQALGGKGVSETLRSLEPDQPRYKSLRGRLESMKKLRGMPWSPITATISVKPDESAEHIPHVRRRLQLLGDLDSLSTDEPSDLYDERLQLAIATFQARHGLEPDSVIGPATLRALNKTPDERIRQIQVNLERWRWLPEDLGYRHIEANIAGFDVRLVEDRKVISLHRAIVGRTYRKTPSFTGQMTYLVLAPYWHVPPTIAAVDKLPLIKRNPGYLEAQRMTLFDKAANTVIDPATVDWSQISGQEFNRLYRLRQDPGPTNALGNVKFMFPNRHNVYLHDTPSRELFNQSSRSFSSGCIRVDRPLELAGLLLRETDWNADKISKVVADGNETAVTLLSPVPVHLLYWTIWVDDDGVIQVRDDIYERDDAVWRAFTKPPPRQRL